jgi:uncharacterized protein (TIGR02246 family)
MKKLLIVIPLVFLFCIAFGCQQGEEVSVEPSVDVEADIQAVKDLVADFNVALNTGDIDKASFYYADEAIVIPPNRPILKGKDASTNDLQQAFERFTFKEVDVVKDVQISGDLAVTHYTWTCETTPKAGGEPTNANGNGIMVLRKQPDGKWKFICFIWSNESLIAPIQATVAVAQSPFIGTWKLNLDKSKFIGSAPLEWTDVYREIEGDQYEVTTKIALADGTTMNEVIVWPRKGGVATFSQGETEGAIEVESMISPNEMIATRIKDGKQIGFINILVSQNGKTMHYTLRHPGIIEGEGVFDKQ